MGSITYFTFDRGSSKKRYSCMIITRTSYLMTLESSFLHLWLWCFLPGRPRSWEFRCKREASRRVCMPHISRAYVSIPSPHASKLNWNDFFLTVHSVSLSCDCLRDDPVVLLATGHSYERAEIQKWLLHHNTCPVSNKEVAGSNVLVTNWNLKKSIQEWRDERFCANQSTPTYKVIHLRLVLGLCWKPCEISWHRA